MESPTFHMGSLKCRSEWRQFSAGTREGLRKGEGILGGHDRSDKGSQADLTDLKIWCKKKGSERKSHGSWPRLALELLQRIGTNKVE